MLNISTALTHLGIRNDTRLGAVQDISEKFTAVGENGHIRLGVQLVDDLLGVKAEFADGNEALLTTQYIVDAALLSEGNVEDGEIALQAALRKVEAFRNKPDNKWIFAKKAETVDTSNQEQVSEMTDVKVAVKADGTIKKGGRQVLAAALYQKYVVEATEKPTNAWFKELLVKELGMSSAGASTYAYNCDAEHKMLVKATKGKKAE